MHKQKMKNDVDIFADKIREFHSKDESEIEFYAHLFNKLSKKKLIDNQFSSYISDKDSCAQRLSELLLTEHCLSSIGYLNPSKDHGPDITFSYQNKTINIEVVTPVKVEQKKASFKSVSTVYFNGPTPRDIRASISIPDEKSLHLRITSVFKDKSEKFYKYIPDIVKKSDINIICINIGFIENIIEIDLAYLKNLFIKQEIISAEMDEDHNVSYDIADNNFLVIKNKDNTFQSSYLDNNNMSDLIAGVWIIVANKDSFPKIKLEQYLDKEKAKNMIYTRNQTPLFKELIHTLSANSYESDDFIKYIRENKALPDC